ncbi:phospholipase D-like domain-containing protein [Enhydrobacter aerosaccus]|uniref:phospholipase D-like domain-containing protein n=1 Tax=Enhydrobacter aerosaccus TaxID=225324 RepID=UPI001C474088|nr:phospholipase D-like domain-containing protein [Enhydrobacter aerosaccus]
MKVRSYQSPTLVLLAYDWPQGDDREDFLGFAIERTPGFDGAPKSWLPNRIGFEGPKPDQGDFPSNEAPIQKFYWWDARIDTRDRGSHFSYRVVPVTGKPGALKLMDNRAGTIAVQVPEVEEHGITSHFNRAVVSSQAFSKRFPDIKSASQQKAARAWLANGMEQAVPQFLDRAAGKDVEGAIYHLTDDIWIIPAFRHYGGALSLAYNHTGKDHASDAAIRTLETAGRPENAFAPRTHASIMHDKFLVRVGAADHPEAVLAGSANFTSEGLSAQANVLHAFESPALAKLYLDRKRLLDRDPGLSQTQHAQTGWSDAITVGDASIRVFFPPEPNGERMSIDTIVQAVNAAQHSVLLCAFDPTDKALLDAVFAASDAGRMMLALVNRVPDKMPSGDPSRADVAAKIEILNRAATDHDIVGFGSFSGSDTPTDFAPERVLWPGENPKIMVRVHHKFVVIDAEGERPVVYTGSANFSGNSLHHNDENLLEITNCPRIAGMYMAEFLRLYEHYRARIKSGNPKTFRLTPDHRWSRKYFAPDTPEAKARRAMAGTA